MVSPVQPNESPQEEPNPILAEIASLDAGGDDADIVREIAALNARGDEDTLETTPSVATAPEAPEAPEAPAKPPPPAGIDPRVQQYIARLEEQQRLAQEAQDARALADFVAEYQGNLEASYGLSPEHAAQLARQHGDLLRRQYEQVQQGQRQIQETEAKAKVAAQIAQKHGVPLTSLWEYPTPQAMERAAAELAGASKRDAEVSALRIEVERLKKASVPPQTFDSNRGTPMASNDERSLLDQYNRGVRTPQTQAAAKKAAGL